MQQYLIFILWALLGMPMLAVSSFFIPHMTFRLIYLGGAMAWYIIIFLTLFSHIMPFVDILRIQIKASKEPQVKKGVLH